MPHPKDLYLPGDNPPDLTGQVDRRIRSGTDGSHLPNPAEVVTLLLAALPAQVPPVAPANPAALTSDREVYQEGIRGFLGRPAQHGVDLLTMYHNLQANTVAAIDQHDPVYGNYTVQQVKALIDPFLNQLAPGLVNGWYGQTGLRIRPKDEVLTLLHRFETLASLGDPNDQSTLGAAYLAAHPQRASFQAVLTTNMKKALAEHLKAMAAVKTALQGAATVPPRGGVDSRWSTDPVVEVAPSELDAEKSSLVTEKAVPATIKTVQTALQALSNLISPAVHATLPIPRFTVYKTGSTESNIRAYTEAGGVGVTIGEKDGVDVVAHEVGHVLENTLSLRCWLDLMLLLQGRHALAGGGTLLPLHPGQRDEKLSKECAYRAEMPAYPAAASDRGSYAARVYGGDSPTEVMSTTLELLVTSKGANTLLTQDPQVLTIVLCWLLGYDAVRRDREQFLASAVPTSP